MTRSIRYVFTLGVAITSFAVASVVWAQTDAHGRVSFADENGLIKGQDDTDWSYAALNSLVLPGDQIWADDSSALEIEFDGGTFVRLADGSRLDVMDVSPNGLFRGVLGSFYVQRVSRSNGDVYFETPVGTLTIETDSQVRIDVLEGGATTVSVRWGRVFIVATGESNSIAVNAGMRTFIDPGYLPSEPVSFDRNEEDSFDSWNRDRARYIAEGSSPSPVDYGSSAPLGVSELNNHGEWVYIDDTPYWRPTVVANYVPYRYGYWSYVPRHGYVWCDNYPFAYVTSHYGYWRHSPRYGWCWRYAGYYRPAYAYTVSYGDYFVWAPLGYDGYPCYSSLYAGFNIGGVHFSYGFSSYAYHYDVLNCYRRVYPVYHHHIYDKHNHHHHNNPHYWRVEADARPYEGAGRPHWPGDSPRTYQPEQVLRGGTTLASDDGRRPAPERARELEARRPDRSGTPVQPGRIARATSTDRSERNAAVRQARVDSPATSRVARAVDPSERGGTASRSRTYSNDEARGADPLSRGSLGSRPSDPAERRSLSVSPSGRVESPGSSGGPGSRPSRPADVSGRTRTVEVPERRNSVGRPAVTERPEVLRPQNGTRPTRPTTAVTSRPQVVRPDNETTGPSEIERPAAPIRPSTRPQTAQPRPSNEPRPATQSRPDVIRPQRPESTSVPTRPQVEATERPSPSRVDVQTRPQVIRPERPTVTPESTRRQVTTTGVARSESTAPQQRTISRSGRTESSTQSQRNVSSPRSVQAPSSRSSNQTFATPQRPSTSSRSFSAPSRSQQSVPRVSAPSRSPSPQISAPSRSSSPQMSAPSRSGGSSSSNSSGGSSRSYSSGSSRSSGGGAQRSPR